MLQSDLARVWHGKTDHRHQYQWIAWRYINANMKLAVLAAEDQRFPFHHGFDFTEINRVIQRAEHRRGASTISQQVAKNLFLWPERSYLRKALEAYFTVLLELCLSKRRILELYLNIAQFGDGIYGVGAASQTFFGVQASALTAAQSALLAAVLPNPLRFQVHHPNHRVRTRQDYLVAQINHLHNANTLEALERPH